MSKAIISKPTRNPMQSGKAKTKRWQMQYERDLPQRPDALMGWTTMPDTTQQVHLYFDTVEEAVAYCTAHGLDFEIREPQKPAIGPKAYAENFAHGNRKAFAANN